MATLSASNREFIRELLMIKEKTNRSFYPLFLGKDFGEGWKISIQGKSQEDTVLVFDALLNFILENEVNAKFALSKCHLSRNKKGISEEEKVHRTAQSHKIATLYCPSDMDIKTLCESVSDLLHQAGYNGWKGISNPADYTKHSDGVYFRNDRDENGKYIAANNGWSRQTPSEK